jgi:hypothetical protein
VLKCVCNVVKITCPVLSCVCWVECVSPQTYSTRNMWADHCIIKLVVHLLGKNGGYH